MQLVGKIRWYLTHCLYLPHFLIIVKMKGCTYYVYPTMSSIFWTRAFVRIKWDNKLSSIIEFCTQISSLAFDNRILRGKIFVIIKSKLKVHMSRLFIYILKHVIEGNVFPTLNINFTYPNPITWKKPSQ